MNRFDTEQEAQAFADAQPEAHVVFNRYREWRAERLPQVGDEVSMGFNGDYYPVGKIQKISKTMSRITTDDGTMFTRVAPNRWKRGGKNGAFSLIQGHKNERNPHF